MADLIEDGKKLYPVAVQSETDGRVLMMAFADDDALTLTRLTGFAHFWSRSRKSLWKKGETSGHVLPVVAIRPDCDGDSFLYMARPVHPVCHRGTPGCFDDAKTFAPGMVETVFARVADRVAGPADPDSYTQRLVSAPVDRILKKVGEEATEVVMAALAPENAERESQLVWESADLLFHLATLWVKAGITPEQVAQELQRREKNP